MHISNWTWFSIRIHKGRHSLFSKDLTNSTFKSYPLIDNFLAMLNLSYVSISKHWLSKSQNWCIYVAYLSGDGYISNAYYQIIARKHSRRQCFYTYSCNIVCRRLKLWPQMKGQKKPDSLFFTSLFATTAWNSFHTGTFSFSRWARPHRCTEVAILFPWPPEASFPIPAPA